MRRVVILSMLCAVVLALACAGVAAAAPAPVFTPATVATFATGDYGSFAEGMAADSHGNLYVSLTTWGDATNWGEIWRIGPGGSRHVVASMDLTPYGMLTGVAVDRWDRVYVGLDDFSDQYGEEPAIGASVWKVQGDGSLTKAVALPGAGMPNGLAFHDGDLYVTDSIMGAVWRAHPGSAVVTVTEPWLLSDLLAPSESLGANGIAFFAGQMAVSVSDSGRILRIPIRHSGAPGTPIVVREADVLKSADGIAFDALGRLWITVDYGTTGAQPSGGLYRLSPMGRLVTIADDPGWLDYPTMPVFGTTARTSGTLYVANGAFEFWLWGTAPSVIALKVGVPGALCW